jgi:hypothetical protein
MEKEGYPGVKTQIALFKNLFKEERIHEKHK